MFRWDDAARMAPPSDNVSVAEQPPIAVAERPPIGRLWHGMRKPANWVQLIQFGVVGASGFIVNSIVYIFLLRKVGMHYLPSAFFAFCVAVLNNFTWNRLWTFKHKKDSSHAAFQAARFLCVSTVAFACNALLLTLFIEEFAMGKVVAQLIAVTLVMPISFLGNKLWSFR
jgi:dolichol-phosphate mannosyltransferase